MLVEAHSVEDNAILVMTLDDKSEVCKQHTVKVGVRNVTALAAEPVVLDGRLFLTGKRALRIDLKTGETKVGPGPKPNLKAPLVFRYGAGLGYASAGRAGGPWEIGKLDPETLACEPVLSRPDDCPWDIVPHPQFDAGLDRCAVVGFQGDVRGDAKDRRWAILVLSEGKLESALELGKGLVVGPLRWGPDRVTIYATLVRLGDTHDTFALYETDFSGSVTRETALIRNPIDEQQRGRGGAMLAYAMPFAMQPSVSPDGHHVAFTTALLPKLLAAEHGLLLINTRDRERKVRRVPFPTSK